MQDISSNKRKRPSDQKLNILILQMVAVGAILLFALCIRLFGGNAYHKLSIMYHERFDDITLASEVLDAKNNSSSSQPAAQSNNVSSETENSSSSVSSVDETDEIEDTVIGYISDYESVNKTVTVAADNNTFMCPVSGRISSEYGYRIHPITREYSMHGGLDIAANSGTDINVAYSGTVTSTGYSNSYGYYIIVSHNDNIQTLYAHCSKIIASKGDEVSKGDVIALVGNTGRTTGSHLHFEVRIAGCRINPRWILGEIIEV